MRPQGPTFWLLESDYFSGPENTVQQDNIAIGASGIELAANSDPASPVGLNSPDASLGGLLLPAGMAIDELGSVYLLVRSALLIRRFDFETQSFMPLPGLGGTGTEARQLNDPSNIAIANRNLFVADRGNRRVQAFSIHTLALRQVWDIEVEDLTAQACSAFILDRSNARVYRSDAGTDNLALMLDEPTCAGKWTRIAVDSEGGIYLLDPSVPQLDCYDVDGRKLNPVTDAGDVRDRFAPPRIRLDYKKRFCLPAAMVNPCTSSSPSAAPVLTAPLELCQSSGLIFDMEGKPARVNSEEPLGPRLYAQKGTWISGALDSQIYGCEWHRIRYHAPLLPSGSSIVVSTYTSAQLLTPADIKQLLDTQWTTKYRTAGAAQQRTQTPQHREFLIQSPGGQYLWLRFQFASDGYGTPSVDSIRVDCPRESYLPYLPAIFSQDDDSRKFLNPFLSIFQTEWDHIEQRIASMAKYFDPAAVPAGPFMDYLASWLALPLEASWTAEQKRRLLKAAPKLYPQIGTPQGVREYLRIYLQNITDSASDQQDAYPQIIEGFRERDHFMLSMPKAGTLAQMGHGAALWGPALVGRLQLGVFATEGQVKLISTGDPEHDIFDEYAHKFRVFVPSSWISSGADERMIRRALDAVKPAHSAYDLLLVEPRFRVGVQSTIGVDTIIGDYPVLRLPCPAGTDVPASRMPQGILGLDTILSGKVQEPPAFRLAAARVGVDTVLN